MARIRVRCGVCNARLKVPEAVCGGVIRCHHCKAKILVPSQSVQGTKTIQLRTSEAGFDVKEQPWLRVQCDCGKVIKAPIEWAGKVGHCPRCGKAHKMPPADSAVSSTLMKVKRVDAFAKRDGDEFTLDDSVNENPNSNVTLIAAPLTDKFDGPTDTETESQPVDGDADGDKEISLPDPDIEASEVVSELARGGKGLPKEDQAPEQTPSELDAFDKGAESSTIHDPSERIKPKFKPKKDQDPRKAVRPVGKPKVIKEESTVIRPAPTPKVKLDRDKSDKSDKTDKPGKPEEFTDFKQYIETSGISLPNIGGFDPDIIEEDDSKYLRVVCSHCGKRVKAPPELSGKTGVCPACGGTIAMPMADAKKFGPVVQLEGISTDNSLLNALDEIAPAPEDAMGLQATGGSGSGLLNAAQSEQQLMTIEGMTATEWEAEKERRAMSIMRYRRGYLFWVASRSLGWVTSLTDRARALPHASPMVAIGIMLALFFAALSMSWSQMPEDYKSANSGLVIPEYYYNGETGGLVEIGPDDAFAKIEKAYRTQDFDSPKVLFKATVLSCTDCENPAMIKIGYIEKWTPEARAAILRRQTALETPEFIGYTEADAQVKKGTFVAKTSDFKWVPYDSEEGQTLVAMPFMCPGNYAPTYCFPLARKPFDEKALAAESAKAAEAKAAADRAEAEKAEVAKVQASKAEAEKIENEKKEAARAEGKRLQEEAEAAKNPTPQPPAIEGQGPGPGQ
jgi:hypothetical protein